MPWSQWPLALLLRVNLTQMWRRFAAVRQQSQLLTLIIGLFIVGYFFLAFGLFYKGLVFLRAFMGLGGLLTERLMFLLFAFLFAMLLLSNVVIGFTNLFRNRETAFLWSLPIPAQTILRWKFLETALLASWAFLFLSSPLLLAYGLTQKAAWHFYLFTPGAVALFVMLPGVLGLWLAITLARFIDRRAFQLTVLATMVLLLAAAAFWMRPEPVPDDLVETRVQALLDRLLNKTRFAQFAFLPSYWLSSAVLQWAEGTLGAALFFVLVLLSHVLLFGFVSFTRFGTIFYDAASMTASRGKTFGGWKTLFRAGRPRRELSFRATGVERCFNKIPGLRPEVRAILVKDARVFWRDTAQWGQTLVLFGLLGVYILNLRSFTQQLVAPFWVHLISVLNLAACSLNLATLTTRFVYPQVSLEGRRLWIVGMAPLGLVRLIRVKFWFASFASLTATLGLVWLSCHLLRLPWERTLYFSGAVVVMTFTLNGMAIGLGCLYPNFKEENPGKIVSGFGGTLCLVLSFVYILASVLFLAGGSPWTGLGNRSAFVMAGSWLGFALLSIGLGWLPLKLGLHRLAKLEL